jgi:hypothetical protein
LKYANFLLSAFFPNNKANIPLIKIYPITIESERDLAREVASIANLSIKLGTTWEKQIGCCPRRKPTVKQALVVLFSSQSPLLRLGYPECIVMGQERCQRMHAERAFRYQTVSVLESETITHFVNRAIASNLCHSY